MRKLLCLLVGLLPLDLAVAGPLRLEPNFVGVTIVEATSGNTVHAFGVNSTELTTMVSLGSSSDFNGAPGENYDVFYSDSDGSFNLDGEYITIQGIYNGNGSGFNIGIVWFDFSNWDPIRANILTNFSPGTSNYTPGSEQLAVDGSGSTATALGQSVNVNAPMSITVGFSNEASVPEPSTFGLAGAALAGVLWRMRRRG